MTERCRPLAALLALLAAVPAGAATFGDLEITPYPEPRGHTSHGYTEYRVGIRHKGKEGGKAHVVRLSLPQDNDASGTRIAAVSRTLEVKPGQSATASLLVPAEPSAYGTGVRVWIDGREMEERVPMSISTGSMMHHRMGGGMLPTAILYSQRVPENFFDVESVVRAGHGRGGVGGGMGGVGIGAPPIAPAPPVVVPGEEKEPNPLARPYQLQSATVRADVPVSSWSRLWLAYTRYDGVVVTVEDLAELVRAGNEGQPVLTALYQYAEAGGVLFVLGPGKAELPASWVRRAVRDRGHAAHSPGFGRCFVTADRDSAKWNNERWSIFDECAVTARPFSGRTLPEANRALPPVDDLGVPVKGLFLLMFVFAVAIGPGNVWLLSKWNRRIWMWWTVPAFSAMTCAMVFGYMVVSEGWQGHAKAAGFTVLDEAEKRATTLGRTSYYSPLSPSDGLRFDTDTEVTVIGTQSVNSFHHRHGRFREHSTLGACEVDWGGDQHFRRGWVPARVPAHFQLRKSKAETRRAIVAREGEELTLTNALGAGIARVVVADEKGRLYEGTDVAEGAKVTLRPTGNQASDKPDFVRGRVFSSQDWASAVQEGNADRYDGLLTPKSYLALVEGAPFVEQALKGAQERQTRSWVLGLME